MNKYLISSLLIGFLIYFTSCEIDDICIEKVLTPRLIVKFYDKTAPTKEKSVKDIYVWAEAKDSLYKKNTVDSISIPLNINANHTRYLLSVNNSIDTLDIYYNKQNVFVSRSCGYKTTFDLEENTVLSNHWTSDFEFYSTPQLIENEAKAHVKIYH